MTEQSQRHRNSTSKSQTVTMSQYEDMPDPVLPITPRRTSEATRIARELLAHPDARLLSNEQLDQLKVYTCTLNLNDQQVEDTIEGELRTLGNRNPATIISMIEHRLKSYRLQVEHKNNIAQQRLRPQRMLRLQRMLWLRRSFSRPLPCL